MSEEAAHSYYLLCWIDDADYRTNITLFDNLEEAVNTCVKECLEWERAGPDMTEEDIRKELKEHGKCPIEAEQECGGYYYHIVPINLRETVFPF